MSRKMLAVVFLALSIGITFSLSIATRVSGRAELPHHSPWGWVWFVIEGAFFFPGALPIVALHKLTGVHLGPSVVIGLSLAFWFFPVGRIRRFFGTFDAVSGKRMWYLPSVSRTAASLLDTLRRLRIGKGKMDGWA